MQCSGPVPDLCLSSGGLVAAPSFEFGVGVEFGGFQADLFPGLKILFLFVYD